MKVPSQKGAIASEHLKRPREGGSMNRKWCCVCSGMRLGREGQIIEGLR